MRSHLTMAALALLVACPAEEDPTATDTESPVPTETESDSDTESSTQTVCEELGLEAVPWQDSDGTYLRNAIAGDATISTTEGDVTLSELWTGCEVFLFIPSEPSTAPNDYYSKNLWGERRYAKELLQNSPKNVHYFFVPSAKNTLDEDLELIQDDMKKARKSLDDEDNAWFEERLHFVDVRSGQLDGWLGEHFDNENFGVGIDRFQRIRFIGSYADPTEYDSSIGWFGPNIGQVAHEAIYYNFEAEREAMLEEQGANVVTLWEEEVMDHGWGGLDEVTIELPDATEMATYDSMWFDLTLECNGDGEYGTCPAWDYLVYLYLCDPDAAGDNPYADTTCTAAVSEEMGTCLGDGTKSPFTCTTDDDCATAAADTGDTAASSWQDISEWSCDGYVAPVAADTLTGTCKNADGDDYEADYTCNEDGTGYDDLACSCPEFGRWITTYHRAGRWAHDVSPLLPLVAEGGTRTFKYHTAQTYEVDLDIRLFDDPDKTERPDEIVGLWYKSYTFSSYNDDREPVEVDIPADASKVELAVIASGHGQNSPGNCAEFCVTEHWFYVDGELNVFSLEDAGEDDRCQEQVAEGTVPNQYGTWWYGRSNWCPGKEVDVHTIDITDQVTPGSTATIEYYGYREGGSEMDANSSNVIINSWLTISREE